MPTTESNPWQQLSPEQQARIIALLVRILLRHLKPQPEVTHDHT